MHGWEGPVAVRRASPGPCTLNAVPAWGLLSAVTCVRCVECAPARLPCCLPVSVRSCGGLPPLAPPFLCVRVPSVPYFRPTRCRPVVPACRASPQLVRSPPQRLPWGCLRPPQPLTKSHVQAWYVDQFNKHKHLLSHSKPLFRLPTFAGRRSVKARWQPKHTYGWRPYGPYGRRADARPASVGRLSGLSGPRCRPRCCRSGPLHAPHKHKRQL